ncbi:hepatocellular carcinoma-associated antigen 59-domain-containing protein [Amylocarpus encephaloides]|uniref:Hepatocellular carcinoma-associated antigen 59-domain-containing protein n=1 Tax=Amylocarpus encephaloides TaxID=45428 RepID=A0A9P7YLN3_9HELO|nr:hepatocellular carcinoma-associated antigen 59-domain-containing protein [Amylocarpus encephaloides]
MSPVASPQGVLEPETPVVFRAFKRRKIYRQRATSEETSDPTTATSPANPPVDQSLDELIRSTAQDVEKDREGGNVSMAEILRMRKQRRGKGGVEFRADTGGASDGREVGVKEQSDEEKAEVALGSNSGCIRKFAPQTGTVGDVDRHMMAYVDSEIAKCRMEGLQLVNPSSESSNPESQTMRPSSKSSSSLPSTNNTEVQRQPAAMGKLHEIDLGDEAREKNARRTDVATRRLNGEEILEESERNKKPEAVRLRPNGRPYRQQKRRGSDDIARDKLVEDVLRENRLEIYDEPPPPEINSDGDQAADDRIAEAFRREFMDSVAARQRKKVAPPGPTKFTTAVAKKEEEALKGPKLGGSRSARAAMREQMLKEGKNVKR